MCSALPKTQKPVVTLRYSPCDDTLTAATAPVTTVEIALLIFKNILFCLLTPLFGTAAAGGVLVPRGKYALLRFW
jgi:hypothetical protein